jgi:hypothetical protein
MISGVSARRPSRRRESRFSPLWVTASRREKPRKPQVPLIVWMVRKTLASVWREAGSASRTIRSWSSRSRFS